MERRWVVFHLHIPEMKIHIRQLVRSSCGDQPTPRNRFRYGLTPEYQQWVLGTLWEDKDMTCLPKDGSASHHEGYVRTTWTSSLGRQAEFATKENNGPLPKSETKQATNNNSWNTRRTERSNSFVNILLPDKGHAPSNTNLIIISTLKI